MKKNNYLSLVFFLFASVVGTAQTKTWTLEECVKYAIENNISIKNTALDIKTAEINKKGAVGNFIPSLNANTSHSWNIGLNQDITTGLLRNQTTQFTSVGGTLGVDIYKGLQNQNTLRRANLAIVASKYQLLKMQEDIALNVANAFLQILFNKENLKVQKEQLAITEKQLTRSEELVKAGSIPRGDVLDIKATVATNKQNVVTAENALLISKLSLAQLLQLKDFYDFDVIDNQSIKDENNILAQPATAIYDKAKESRTELKIAKTNLEVAQKDLAIAKGAFQPTLQGFYNYNTRIAYADRIGLDQNGNPVTKSALPFWDQFRDNKGQAFGAQLSIPIFNGWSVKNNVERNKVNLEKSKIALEQQELDLQRNVYTAFTDAKGALKTHESAIVALESRQEAFNYAKERYAVGMMNSFDFNQAQTLLTNAQSEVIRTKYDYIFKIKILEFYFGIPILKN
ncbi:TolC family protein [Flavobacterium succinicans]|uniref:Outer membrane protein TolC n=1 Tax=Flavobacterium succinicans TaxID=29536 RepID=A0A199XMP3_9FLAO|nr:TolC family protein [Flavobacterium succinicans]OAZ02925.1 outer membrane protein TolC precursor [Flavobacterium succinicans]